MASLHIEIDSDDAAFAETPAAELASILRKIADRLESGEGVPAKLYDTNGNACGHADAWLGVDEEDDDGE